MWLVAIVPLLLIAVLLVGGTLFARSRGYSNMGGWVVVRCREGHLFTTIWVPLASLKAVRLGRVRWQRCPVGNHWTFVAPIKDSDLTEEERLIAEQYRDTSIP